MCYFIDLTLILKKGCYNYKFEENTMEGFSVISDLRTASLAFLQRMRVSSCL